MTLSLTRHDALHSWAQFLPKVPAYARTRNQVQPGHGNVSGLSGGIRFRTLLEDEILRDTLAHCEFQEAEKWLQEVCWRRYWKGWLEMRPQVWTQWRLQVRQLRHTLPSEVLARAEAVAAGKSGVACMDHIARELLETGYLHNHARMWWASFWIHVEQLPWELGADFFFRHLLDADPASNTLSWRWVAGLQTPGKTYLVRLSNIQKHAPWVLEGREAGCERLADGAVEARVPQPGAEIPRQPLTEYPTTLPAPGRNSTRAGLWLHPEDLTPEIGPLSELAPAGIAACLSNHTYRAHYQLSSQRITSLHTVLRDGLDRAAAHYRVPAAMLEADDPVQSLCAWARDRELTEIVSFAPTVGPIHDIVPQLRHTLGEAGIRLTLVRRPSDATAFSFATAGFFPFWQKMSRHLKGLQTH